MPESVPGDATPTADNGLADEAAMVRENMAVEDVVQRSGAGTVAERRTAIRAYYAAQDKAEIERLTADRDRLRAEVERLRTERDQVHAENEALRAALIAAQLELRQHDIAHLAALVPVSDQPEPPTRPSTITDAYGNRWTP